MGRINGNLKFHHKEDQEVIRINDKVVAENNTNA